MGALLRKREAPATISTPATAADIVATVHYVVAVCLRNYIFSWCFIALLVPRKVPPGAEGELY